MANMTGTYRLKCLGCGFVRDDDGVALDCPREHAPALLVTEYDARQVTFDDTAPGVFRYAAWLPARRRLASAGRTITYQSERLGRALGLEHLWVAYNGYWPERGAAMETATFKELEAYAVLARLPHLRDGALVLASAGNTAAAFAINCSRHDVPCVIVMPASGLHSMRFAEPLAPCVRIVALGAGADYSDAIALAGRLSACEGFVPEGGVKNVGRRDGLGTTLLSAVEAMGRLPAYYFQAVGSGSGGIAVHEAAKRLVADGRFGDHLPRLMLSQNLPFAPMYDAWRAGWHALPETDDAEAKAQIQRVAADVLTNRRPPYAVVGGVYDALRESGGDMLVADNAEARAAMVLFRETEGIDIEPAPGVALATLAQAVADGRVERDATILLHVTGGGRARRAADTRLLPARPALEVTVDAMGSGDALDRILDLFGRTRDVRVPTGVL